MIAVHRRIKGRGEQVPSQPLTALQRDDARWYPSVPIPNIPADSIPHPPSSLLVPSRPTCRHVSGLFTLFVVLFFRFFFPVCGAVRHATPRHATPPA